MFLLTPKDIIRDTVSSWILNFFRHGRRCHRSFLFILPPISSASTLHIYSCVRVCVRLRYPSFIVTIAVCAGIPLLFRSAYHELQTSYCMHRPFSSPSSSYFYPLLQLRQYNWNLSFHRRDMLQSIISLLKYSLFVIRMYCVHIVAIIAAAVVVDLCSFFCD